MYILLKNREENVSFMNRLWEKTKISSKATVKKWTYCRKNKCFTKKLWKKTHTQNKREKFVFYQKIVEKTLFLHRLSRFCL